MTKAYLAECDKCPLKDQPFVPPTIPENPQFTLVGEAPGRKEVKRKQPFVGMSGNLLSQVLEQEGYDRSKIHITNSVLCWPKDNETPNAEAISCCNKRLLHEIKEARTKRVLATGMVAANAVTLEGVSKITKERGKVVKGKGDFDVKITLHPAYILRNYSALPDLRNDIRTVLDDGANKETEYEIVTNYNHFQRLLMKLYKDKPEWVAYDLETTSLVPHLAKVLCLVLTWEAGSAYVIPDNVFYECATLISHMFGYEVTWVGWNSIKYDNQVLAANGVLPPINCYDGLLSSYALDERRGHGLKRVAVSLLNVPDWEAELKSHLPRRKSKKDKDKVTAVREDSDGGYSDIPVDILNKYAARDVDMTLQAARVIDEKLQKQPAQLKLYSNILVPTAHMLSDMEYRGFRVDRDLLYETIDKYVLLKQDFVNRMRTHIGNEQFNPNSTDQLGKILFEDMGFEPVLETPGGKNSVAAPVIEVLQMQQNDNTFLNYYVDFKKIEKILSSYLLPFSRDALQDKNGDWRLYPQFLVHGTTTGRLSGSIWMTWPRKDTNKYGAILKYLVLPERGHLMVAADYSQLELRVITCEAHEEKYKYMFENGIDPHEGTTDVMYGTDWHDFPDRKQWRTRGKTINFAIAYGAGVNKIAFSAGIMVDAARELLATYNREFNSVKDYFDGVKKTMREDGFIETAFGRRRYFELQIVGSGAEKLDNLWKIDKEACNFAIQSPANDLNFLAALEDVKALPDSKLMFMVHDSIEMSVPEDKVEERAATIKEIGESLPHKVYSDYIPFEVDVKWGKSWGDAEEK